MSKVLFFTATAAEFTALENKNDFALYFITDTGEFYKGNTRFGTPVKFVTEFPATGELGVLYVNTSGKVQIWNGEAYISVVSDTNVEWLTLE